MKTVKPLQLEQLTTRQKLGMVMTGHIYDAADEYNQGTDQDTIDNMNYALDMIRNHALGAIWVDPRLPNLPEIMAKIREAADYPILIVTDAESGIGDHLIGRHGAIGSTGNPELAYIFGKVTAVTARQMGYNVVCNPVLDMTNKRAVCGANVRSLGSDKYKVTELAAAEAQGLKDGGVLTVGKHYPSAMEDGSIDSHMAETASLVTVDQLLEYNLYPYLELNKRGLLDGIMTGHCRCVNIDPDYPASLSKKVIQVIRDHGFEGFAITDAMVMMGVVAKFGDRACKGMAIGNGNDLSLTWYLNVDGYESICEAYDNGLIADDRLDEAVSRVLAAQTKTMAAPKFTELTQEDIRLFDSINWDATYGRADEGLSTALSRDGKHFFAVLVENEVEIKDNCKVNVATMHNNWHHPDEIIAKLEALFLNSTCMPINEYPSPAQSMRLLEKSVGYEDVIFITYMHSQAYVGRECLTSRIISIIEAMQVTNRVSTVVHFGNPYVLEDLPHIPRILIGSLSADNVSNTLDILAGKYPAKGVLTYDVNFQ